jgi:hypothetical protein
MAGVLPWSAFSFIDQQEHVPELTWPSSVTTYHTMRTDSQVNGLFLGVTMPIRRYKWVLALNQAREEVAQQVAFDLNIPLQGDENHQTPLRQRDSFGWDDFLRHALLALAYGFYYFEPVGQIVNGMWRLKDIAPRPPATISQVDVDTHGALVSVKQAVGFPSVPIPANRILPFVWDREGGNWFGRSLFRSMYKHWLIKDRMYRVDAIKNERTGLGMPTVEAPPGASRSQIEDLDTLAKALRVGDYSGAALPAGARLRLVGTEGALPDTLATIQAHDEAMARSLLMMFIQLGQTRTGSRSLGESFIDYFALAQETIAVWFEDTMTNFLIEDIVDWNWGPEEPAPRVTHERDPSPDLSVIDLCNLIQNDAITVDPETEAYLRDRYLLPPKDPNQPSLPKPSPNVTPQNGSGNGVVPGESQPSAPQVASRRKRTTLAQGFDSLLPLPNRPLRRQLYRQEVAAKVDFAAMDSDFDTVLGALVAEVRNKQPQQFDELRGQIEAAGGNLEKIAAIEASPIFASVIQSRLVQMAQTGATQAVTEAARQGITISMPDLVNVFGRLSSRSIAVDSLLAKSISETAGRKALSLAGTSKTAGQVASETVDYLSGFSSTYLQQQLGGAIQQAMNAGRKAVFNDGPASQLYASELLDSNTCEECVDIDGTEYPDLDAAETDYPTGGYMDCLGGPKCRGTLVAVYSEVEGA